MSTLLPEIHRSANAAATAREGRNGLFTGFECRIPWFRISTTDAVQGVLEKDGLRGGSVVGMF